MNDRLPTQEAARFSDSWAGRFEDLLSPIQDLLTDPAVVTATLYRLWKIGSGPLGVIVITAILTPEQQGYWYTFNSLGNLGLFVELGLLSILVTFVGHEWSHLSLGQQGRIAGDPDALSRLQSLTRFGMAWFLMGALLLMIITAVVGYIVISRQPTSETLWKAPFGLMCIVLGLNTVVLFVQSLLEGCNQVREMYSCRLGGDLSSSLLQWGMLLAGLGLWALPLSITVSILWSTGFVLLLYRRPIVGLLSRPAAAVVDWRAEIVPLQWRSALSSIAGYVFFGTFVPLMFMVHGAVLAGQAALTIVAIDTLHTMALVPVATKIPVFNMLIAKNDRTQLNRLLIETGLLSCGLVLAGGIVLELLIYSLNGMHNRFSARLLPTAPTAVLLIGAIVKQGCTSLTVYVRAHKAEPFVWLAICQGFFFLGGLLLVGRKGGAMGFALVHTGVMLASAPIIVAIFRRYRAN